MQVTKENKDDLNAVIRVTVEKPDYEGEVNNKLKEYKKKANMPGFRPGMVPIGLIKKMYYKPLLVEEINRLVTGSLSKFIEDEKLNILGEPLTSKEEQKEIDFDSQENFEFVFEIGIAPEIDVTLSKDDKLTYHVIDAEGELIDRHAESYTSRYGKMINPQEAGGEDVIKGELRQLTGEGEIAENGITVDEATLSLRVIKDEEIRNQVTGSKPGDLLQLDLKKAYPNETDLSRLLGVDKEQVDTESMFFQLTIKEISRWEKAELNQELFDKAFGEGEVTSEEEFRNRIREEIEKAYAQNSDYKLFLDTRKMMLEKVTTELPEDFIRRWLLETNQGKLTEEALEKDFDKVKEDLKWQLIQDTLIKKFDLKVEPDEVEELARHQVMMQFQQYGMANVPREHINNYAGEMLKKEPERRRLYEQKFQEKITAAVKETATLQQKKVKEEEFNKLFDQ
jgi:trigger factor